MVFYYIPTWLLIVCHPYGGSTYVTTALMSMLIVPAHSSVKCGIKVRLRYVVWHSIINHMRGNCRKWTVIFLFADCNSGSPFAYLVIFSTIKVHTSLAVTRSCRKSSLACCRLQCILSTVKKMSTHILTLAFQLQGKRGQ